MVRKGFLFEHSCVNLPELHTQERIAQRKARIATQRPKKRNLVDFKILFWSAKMKGMIILFLLAVLATHVAGYASFFYFLT